LGVPLPESSRRYSNIPLGEAAVSGINWIARPVEPEAIVGRAGGTGNTPVRTIGLQTKSPAIMGKSVHDDCGVTPLLRLAEQLAELPLVVPPHVQVKGPVPDTEVGVPVTHRPELGILVAELNEPPLAEPQAPLIT
jgi:hypothetical protein